VHPGDVSYADAFMSHWDVYFRKVQVRGHARGDEARYGRCMRVSSSVTRSPSPRGSRT
jgi:hypothetical protein